MTREVNLVSHLPSFLAEFKEIAVTLKAENPEFVLTWKAADRVLKNEFIELADEYGISRFEKILNILPSSNDTLESRRAKIRTQWFNNISGTLKGLISKLTSLCGNSDFTITKRYDKYQIEILTSLEMYGQVEELERVANSIIPCNIIVILKNGITCTANGFPSSAGAICFTEQFIITD